MDLRFAFLRRVGSWLGRAWRAGVGEFNWQPPRWLGRSAAAAGRARAYVVRRPRFSGGIALGVVALLAAGYGGWRWYASIPRPVEYDVTVINPERTCIECEPAGTPNALLLQFDGSVAPLQDAGKVVDPKKAHFGIRPAIAGEWRWRDDRTLAFTPAADWPVGQAYRIEFARQGFTAPQVRLARYSADAGSPAFVASIANTEFYQDPVVASGKKVVTTLQFSHPVDTIALEKRVHVRLFAKVTDTREEEQSPAPGFTVTYDKLKLHAYLHTSQLALLPKGGRVQLTIDKGLRAAAGGNESGEPLGSGVEVPGLYSLAVHSADITIARDERDTPSQALVIGTSHSVGESEMSSGVRAWVLPLKHPDAKLQAQWEQYRKDEPYAWNEMQVTPAVLAAAESLPLAYVPNERDHVEVHSFGLKAEPGRQVYVLVDKSLTSFGGYLMAKPFDRLFTVPPYPREVRIGFQGSLLALTGPRKLLLMTRDLQALQVQVGRLLPDQLQHLVTQSGGDFSHPSFNNYEFNEANLTERYTDVLPVPRLAAGVASYQSLDLAPYLAKPGNSRRGIFLLHVQAWDPEAKRPIAPGAQDGATADTRLVVITDLGLIAKRSVDGTQDVFVQSIASGEPVAGARVQVIGRNGEAVLAETSDAQGHVRFPDLREYRDEREPVLYLAERAGDSSFLPMRGHVDNLDLSRFDVGGVSNRAERAALSAFLFSDRGIYRPGEEIRAAMIVKAEDWRRLPEGLPLRVEIADPRGIAIRRELLRLGSSGFEQLRQRTRVASPVGNYTINVYLVKSGDQERLIGSTTVKLQEFLPDRLRMSTHLSVERPDGWVAPGKLQALVGLENLFGTPASARRIRATMRLSPAAISFPRYRDFQFRDPQAASEGFTENLAEATTGEDGQARLDLNLERFTRATYRVNLVVQGFEADGGRGVTGEAAQLVSSLPFLVGWKADGRLDFVARGAARSVDLLAIDPALARIAPAGLKLRRIERRYVSVLLKQNSGLYKYESRLKEVPIDERPLALPDGTLSLPLDTATPGNFSYVVADEGGQVYARVDYTVAGAANLSRSMEKNAELHLVLDKHDYAPGETISMQVQAPYTGSGLITIERDHVYAWQWFHTTTTGSVQKIRVPEGLEGNGYVSISFVRDPSSEEIHTSPLSYGVQPFSIALDARRNAVTLRAPALVKPGADLAVSYRSAAPARMALFAVDEGILQVAHYSTPDPLGHFFKKRSLDVSTRQILDLILPGFRSSMLSAPGGDQSGLLGANLNPFRRKTDPPVAWWAGIVDSGPREQTLHWTVPDTFNGRLRIVAVAVNDAAIGVAEQPATVRGDFVLSPNAPLTATPGDEFEVSVGVANNVEDSGPKAAVEVTLEPSAQFELLGAGKATLAIGALHESTARFRLRVRDALGSGALRFRAALGTHSAQQTATVSLRPATPYATYLAAGSFKGSARVPTTHDLYPAFRTLDASVSVLPLALAHGLSAYLGHYAYSCTEQLVSMAMPAIVLSQRPEFGTLKAQDGANLASLVDELRARQVGDGSFRYWAGGVESVDFVSVYALHVLLEAGERGQPVPADLLESGKAFLLRMARRDGDNLADERTSAYAIYLLARQGLVVSNEAATLQQRLATRYAKQWRGDIVAAYLAAAYQLMQQKTLAERTIAGVGFGGQSDIDMWHGPMANDAMLVYLLARHFPERLAKLPADALEGIVQHVQSGDYNSLSAATAILGLDAYATASQALPAAHLAVTATLADKSSSPLQLPAGLFPKAPFAAGTRSLDFSSDGPLRAYYLVNESGFEHHPPATARSDGLEITREFLDASNKPAATVRVGDEVTVHLRFRAIGRSEIADAVLVDLLPGGFDLVIPNAAPQEQQLLAAAADARGNDMQQAEAEDQGDEPRGCLCLWLVSRPAGFPRFADLREDRVVLYGRATDQVQEFSYRIKATNAGSFVVPPAFGEAMYDPKVRAHSVAGQIVVERP